MTTVDTLLAQVGKDLADARDVLRLSQKQIAKRAGLSPTVVGRNERCANMQLETLIKHAEALGCDVKIVIVQAGKEAR